MRGGNASRALVIKETDWSTALDFIESIQYGSVTGITEPSRILFAIAQFRREMKQTGAGIGDRSKHNR